MLGELVGNRAIRVREFSSEAIHVLERDCKILVIEPKSINQLLAENNEYFGHVNHSPSLRDFVPRARQVAIKRDSLLIPESNNLAPLEQFEKIEEINKDLKNKGIHGAKAVWVDAATLCQLDIQYQKIMGKKLIVGYYACSSTNTSGDAFSGAGRISPNGKLVVISCSPDQGNRFVSAVRVLEPQIAD